MRSSQPYRLVILDFDGTLADSGEWFAREFNGVARRFRFREVSRAELEVMRAEQPLAMLRRLGVPRWKLPLIARYMRGLMNRDIAQIALFPGVAHLLASLQEAGITVAVLSSNAESNVRKVLGPALCRHVDHFDCGSALLGKARKIRKLIARCGLSAEVVLAVGDEMRDIDAAEEAGVASGAVLWGYGDAATLRARRPTLVFTTMEDIGAAVLGSCAPAAVAQVHA